MKNKHFDDSPLQCFDQHTPSRMQQIQNILNEILELEKLSHLQNDTECQPEEQ
jgi:hypothetical protein